MLQIIAIHRITFGKGSIGCGIALPINTLQPLSYFFSGALLVRCILKPAAQWRGDIYFSLTNSCSPCRDGSAGVRTAVKNTVYQGNTFGFVRVGDSLATGN